MTETPSIAPVSEDRMRRLLVEMEMRLMAHFAILTETMASDRTVADHEDRLRVLEQEIHSSSAVGTWKRDIQLSFGGGAIAAAVAVLLHFLT